MEVRPTKVLICVNLRFQSGKPSCAARGSLEIAEAIERGVLERNLDRELLGPWVIFREVMGFSLHLIVLFHLQLDLQLGSFLHADDHGKELEWDPGIPPEEEIRVPKEGLLLVPPMRIDVVHL